MQIDSSIENSDVVKYAGNYVGNYVVNYISLFSLFSSHELNKIDRLKMFTPHAKSDFFSCGR